MSVYWYYRQSNDSPLVTAAYLARERAIQLPSQYAREHENCVTDGADSFTNSAEVNDAMQSGWTEQAEGQPDVVHEHFWDFGSVIDPTVGGCGHVKHGIIYLDALVTFQGSHDAPVLLPVIKQAIIQLALRFPPKRIRIESWQGISVAQELKAEGLPVVLFAPTAKAHAEEWPVLANRLVSRTLRLFPHARLREELLNLTYEVGPSGVRVTDKGRIHNDHAVCLRGVVAGLAGPVLAPWTFLSEGQRIGTAISEFAGSVASSITHALTATDKALTSAQQTWNEPAKPIRSIETIERLDEGVRSPEEQRRLDEAYAKRKREHKETDFERYVRIRGVHFPDGTLSEPGIPDALEQIRQQFQQWR